ncbi:MAG: N-acetyl-gamma-glutamyl-phosphate reductase [Deltaproteobacteria bacterium]|nr:N-acetyl-gamma-glutamyl-phosphate reductase [Deltaproteobacteria bacterium]
MANTAEQLGKEEIMIKVKVVGAGGYGGVGIIELLLEHPETVISALVDVENVGVSIAELYPHLDGFCDLTLLDPASADAQQQVDVVFMATPDKVGMKLAPMEIEKGAKVIDYSGDFRFNSESAYADYASRIGKSFDHASPRLLKDAVYGIPELHRREISPETKVVGNPGCFAVGCILGLAPAVKSGLVKPEGIICDCKTGVSGAGKKVNPEFHYPARYDNMNAYRLAGHQHVCEIERELGLLAGSELQVTFTAQVLPVCRGIMSTLYGELTRATSEKEVLQAYQNFYRDEPFIRLYDSSARIGSMHVRGTNACALVISVDRRTRRLRVVSYIDNLMKGQAGSALQNMNLLFGLPETLGLKRTGRYP